VSGFSRTRFSPGGHYTASVTRISRSYLRVLVIWVAVLVALYAFQEYFS
jgi:hypothetical protein